MKLDAFPKAFFCLLLMIFSPTFSQEEGTNPSRKILAGYYPDWGVWNHPSYTVDLVPYKQLTHVIWSFISPNEDGSLRGDAVQDPSDLDQMVKLAHDQGVKVILSLGGAGLCENFAPVSKNEALRSKFVKELMEFVEAHHLDGVDMDWEYSKVPVASEDTAGYNKLLKDIRTNLPQGKTLSAALPCSDYYGKFFTAEALLENLDWFGLMTYDITGDWDEKARFDSPLLPNSKWTTWSWKQAAAYWTKRGVPASKIVMGVPSFGFVFHGATGPGSDFDYAEQESYADILKMADWQLFYDDISKEPYGIADDMFVTYEDARSSIEKASWIVTNNYAGAMVWELSHDYLEEEKQPIINALSTVLLDGIVPDRIGTRRSRTNLNSLSAGRYTYDALGQFVRNRPASGHYYNR